MEKTKEQLNKKLAKVLGGNMITVHVQLFEPYVVFAKDYLQFFGSKDTLEVFCMRAIYDSVNRLHRDLTEFAKNKDHFLDSSEWYEKHSHVAITSDQPEDEDC